MALFETKVNIGQKIYGAEPIIEEVTIMCNTCDGEGIVKIKNENFTCPKCNGLHSTIVSTVNAYKISKEHIKNISIFIQEDRKILYRYETNKAVLGIEIDSKDYETLDSFNFHRYYFLLEEDAQEFVNYLNKRITL